MRILKMDGYYYYIKPTCRLILMVIFLISTISITFSWISFGAAFCLAISYIFFSAKSKEKTKQEYVFREWEFVNPFKGMTGKQKNVDIEKEKEFNLALGDYLLYNAAETKSVQHFELMKKQSDCVFAKRAQIWGSPDYNESISIEENMKSIYPTFLKFISCIQSRGLDAYVIELPGHLYGSDIKCFGDAVGRSLRALKNCDNIRRHNKLLRLHPDADLSTLPDLDEDTTTWSKNFWVLEMHSTTFFVTTFAPFYPETNSRYSFGLPDCYILFQPEMSFAIHDLPPDTPTTNWLNPVTVRDRIRKAYHDKGREYTPPMVEQEPMVYEIVKRIEPEDDVTKWWIDSSLSEKNHPKEKE